MILLDVASTDIESHLREICKTITGNASTSFQKESHSQDSVVSDKNKLKCYGLCLVCFKMIKIDQILLPENNIINHNDESHS